MSKENAEYKTKEKTIFRVNKNAENPFVMMDKRPIENDSLSWKAKGLLSYLLSRPDDWTVRMGDLIKRSKDGDYSTRGAVRELIEAGHLVRKQERKEGGAFDEVTYDVFEVPLRGFPQADNPQADNLTLNKIDSTKKDLNNTSPTGENSLSDSEFWEKKKAEKKVTPKEERKPVQVAGIEAAIMSGRKVTEEDRAATAGETIQSRLSNWPDDSITIICREFAEAFDKLPPAAPLSKKEKAPFYYAWRDGAGKVMNIEGKGDKVQIIKAISLEYDGKYTVHNPGSLAQMIYDRMNKVAKKSEEHTLGNVIQI